MLGPQQASYNGLLHNAHVVHHIIIDHAAGVRPRDELYLETWANLPSMMKVQPTLLCARARAHTTKSPSCGC